ncbi:polysaccharide biosynthesis/export family protein [Pelagicoccus sp. SDUM812005]|uniref:polysaccharide biosynthesis/export family protein n=1 Tax=Pelagicoccus sp. SDUM812005 TaxID=3041257 RepID=UPI00280CAB16|nr:polysaccharide biosynthesis/export family protein [Pelagicoccus sp. SDUM812005]MDQ8180641.1 polysaccharide export protein [Pelagicoccus sp. SDUM812005]
MYSQSASPYRYAIQPGDVLRIDFATELSGNRDITVQPDGWISPPHIPAFQASRLTLEELEDKLENAYAKVLRFSDLTLDLVSSHPLYIYVGGEVTLNGRLPYQEGTTVRQAILQAGGTRKGAALKKAFVIRDTGKDIPAYLVFDFNNLDPAPYHDLYLQPKDIVIVPKTGISKFSHFIDSYINEILPFSRSVNANYYSEDLKR